MNFGSETLEEESALDINMTPLIDCVFLLLIFFAVSTTFADTAGIAVKLPKAETGQAAAEPKELFVTVDKAGRIFLGDKSIALDTLSAKLSEQFSTNKDLTLIVRADTATQHGKVVSIMDIARKIGIEKMAIATQSE